MQLAQIMSQLIVIVRSFFKSKNAEIEPRDILVHLLKEVEKRKKHGIEEKAFVPNSYIVYLCPADFEEMYPLIAGVREQLKSRLDTTIKKKGYKLLSNTISLEIREDANMMKSQIVIKSLFIKPKSVMPECEKNALSEKHEVVEAQDKGPKEFKALLHHPAAMKKEENTLVGRQRVDDILINTESLKDTLEETGEEPCQQSEPYVKKCTQMISEKETKYINPVRAKLELLTGDRSGSVISLQDGEHTFGRGSQSRHLIQDLDETVSRLHFRLVVKEKQVRLWDMNSLNGTKVNDVEVEEAELSKGDVIAAGKVLLRVA